MTLGNLIEHVAPFDIDAALLADVAAQAGSVDADAAADRRGVLAGLARAGLLDPGLPGSTGTYLDQTRVLAALASRCMSTAFSAWAHRMTLEYIGAHSAGKHRSELDALTSLDAVGSTAMAGTFRAATGQEELTVRITEAADGTLVANGFIPWASNLYDNAIIVTGMLHDGVRRIVVIEARRRGVGIEPTPQLMALDASRSGSIRLVDVPVDAGDFIDVEFMEFVRAVRPVFLAMQSSFCLGLAAGSLDSIRELQGVAKSLQGNLDDHRSRWSQLCGRNQALATWLTDRQGTVPVDPVRVRLEAGRLAVSATQLELAICGGRSYEATSATSRRVREALFLPVQSPTEAQLQWELQQSR